MGAGCSKTVCGSGGGTWGSLFSLVLWGPVLCLLRTDLKLHEEKGFAEYAVAAIIWTVALLVVYFVGVISIPTAEGMLGEQRNWRKILVRHDQSEIVIDEWLGIGITMLPLLFLPFQSWWAALGLSFGLFRVFDMLKLPPVRFFDRMESADGVMLDDAFAAALHAAPSLVGIWFVKVHFTGAGF